MVYLVVHTKVILSLGACSVLCRPLAPTQTTARGPCCIQTRQEARCKSSCTIEIRPPARLSATVSGSMPIRWKMHLVRLSCLRITSPSMIADIPRVVVNIGEMWEIWSNNLYKATLHRVIHRGDNYRVSVPFFYEPAFDARIEPLPAALRLQERLHGPSVERKKGVVYGNFLLQKVGGNFAKDGEVKKGRY